NQIDALTICVEACLELSGARKKPDALAWDIDPDRTLRPSLWTKGFGCKISGAQPIFPTVTEIQASVEMHLLTVLTRGIVHGNLLNPDHGLIILFVAFPNDHTIQLPVGSVDA